MTIEDVHYYLDQVEGVIEFLNETTSETVTYREIEDLCSIVGGLHGWRTAYVDGPQLGISPSVLNKYVKYRDEYPAHEARIVAQRVRSFLRNLDQASLSHGEPIRPETPRSAPPPEPAQKKHAPTSERLTIRAESWQIIGTGSDLKVKIHALSMLLDEIIQRTRGANVPPEQQALTQLERAQLVTILETTLAVLKAPMVETGLLKKAGKALSRVVRKAAEKKVEEGLGSLADMASNEIADVLNHLPDQFPGS